MRWLLGIVLLGLVLRVVALDKFPIGFHVDEVKVGWNAYSLLLTGRDDWWHSLPLHYDSFGDFRPTGYFYAAAPILALLGLTQTAVRLAPALFGTLSLVIIYAFVYSLTHHRLLATLSAGVLLVSPWHLSLSRASSEGVISLALTLLGLTLLLRHRLNVASVFLILPYFFYHPARMLTPLFVLAISWHQRRMLWIPLIVTALATGLFMFNPAARGRLNQISIFNNDAIRYELMKRPFEEGPNQVLRARAFNNKVIIYGTEFLAQYSQYLSGRFFLAPWEAKPVRYSTVGYGILLHVEFLLLFCGLVALAQRRFPQLQLPLLLLLLAPIPAALTLDDIPNLHRSLYMIPSISVLVAAGLVWLKEKNNYWFWGAVIALNLNFVHFAEMYVIHNPQRDIIAIARNAGVPPLFTYLRDQANHYSDILLTRRPDSLYPWYAFYNRLNPAKFNAIAKTKRDGAGFSYQGWQFTALACPSQELAKHANALAIDAVECRLTENDKIIFHSYGVPAYILRN